MNLTAAANPVLAPHAPQTIQPASHRFSELLDVLYEILASGMEPDGARVSMAEIETFLHQHARQAKTPQELEAFFRDGGLPTRIDSIAAPAALHLSAVPEFDHAAVPLALAAARVQAETITAPQPVRDASAAPSGSGATIHASDASDAVDTHAPISDAIGSTYLQHQLRRMQAWIAALSVGLVAVSCAGAWIVMELRDQLTVAHGRHAELVGAMNTLEARTQQVDARLVSQADTVETTQRSVERLVSLLIASGE